MRLKIYIPWLLLLMIGSISRDVSSAEQIRMIEDGRTDYRILISPDASPTEEFAAYELQGYMVQVSGTFLPMDRGDARAAEKHILVGGDAAVKLGLKIDENNPGPDGFAIKTMGDKIVLAGGSPRGTLYSVYAFLEMLGCRWHAPGIIGEVIPQMSTVTIVPMDRSERPDLTYRGFTSSMPDTYEGAQWIDWMCKNRMNYLMIPLSNYADFKTILGGELEKRQMYVGVDFHDLMPDGDQFPADQILGFIDDNPEVDIIGLPAKPLEVSSELYEEFIAKTTQAAREKYPDRAISLMVHGKTIVDTGHLTQASEKGPKASAPGLDAPYPEPGRCYRHSLGDSQCEINSEVRSYLQDRLEAWTGVHVYEHYMGSYSQNSLLFPILHTISSDLKYFSKLEGLEGVISQCEPGNRGTYGLNYYVFARMTWDAGSDLGSIVDDYCERYFGSASVPMKRYFTRLEDAMADMEHFRYIDPPHLILKLLDQRSLAELAIEVQNAEGLADDAIFFDRIRKIQLSLEHARLLWYTLHYYFSAIQRQQAGKSQEAKDYFQKSIDMGERLVTFIFQNIDEGVFIIPESYIFEYLQPLIADARGRKGSPETE